MSIFGKFRIPFVFAAAALCAAHALAQSPITQDDIASINVSAQNEFEHSGTYFNGAVETQTTGSIGAEGHASVGTTENGVEVKIGGKVGGEVGNETKIDLGNAGILDIIANVFFGGKIDASVIAELDPSNGDAYVKAAFEALLGVSASLEGTWTSPEFWGIKLVVKGTLEGHAGIGASGSAKVGMEDWVFVLGADFDIAALLGFGAGLEIGIDFSGLAEKFGEENVRKILEALKKTDAKYDPSLGPMENLMKIAMPFLQELANQWLDDFMDDIGEKIDGMKDIVDDIVDAGGDLLRKIFGGGNGSSGGGSGNNPSDSSANGGNPTSPSQDGGTQGLPPGAEIPIGGGYENETDNEYVAPPYAPEGKRPNKGADAATESHIKDGFYQGWLK